MEVAVVGERCLLAGGCRWLVPSLNLRRRLRRTCAPHVCPAHLPLRPCRKCGGEGTTVKNPCKKCSGAGRVRTTKTVQVVVPPGIDSGISMRLSGQGDAGERGGPAGHLFVQVRATALRCPSRPVPSHPIAQHRHHRSVTTAASTAGRIIMMVTIIIIIMIVTGCRCAWSPTPSSSATAATST